MRIVKRFLAKREIRKMFTDLIEDIDSEPLPEWTLADLLGSPSLAR